MSSTHRYIDALGHGLSDKRIDILRGIGRTGSISQAARDAGVSYKAAWQAIDTLGNLAGVALLERAVGGAGGGGATLTGPGLELLALADAMEAARREVQQRFTSGAAAVPQDAPRGAGPALGWLALRTSMRNQLPARIEQLEGSGPVVRVGLRLGQDGHIAARITQESVQLLGLAPGMAVIALCKATAVQVSRAAPGAKPSRAAANRLEGSVIRVARGDSGDEITLALAPGLQLVGFAPSGSGLRVRQRVRASVDESSVVVALGA
ncbi:TOBE domain-containing protein [Variovorax sp. OV329]|uniref:TOBE domain-containing protein n=1 Tax=Variovorax sp. OV329 TaxID=1882825 RepID=UPI0008E3BB12|nr:TOBE domain-containing protein [Variovorax sp. OV329]SFM22096.1 molybdate transport system regulatory protein [Variovorax sp. OV329]